MDWLSKYLIVIDCVNWWVTLFTKNAQIIYQANQYVIQYGHILKSLPRGRKRLETYDSIFTISDEIGMRTNYLGLFVVDEFPEDLPGLPLDWEFEFCIGMVPRAQSGSITPYRIAPIELIDLRRQLDEFLEKDFIKSSTTP